MVYTNVLATIVYPKVHDTWIALCFTHGIGNVTATLGVFNPEVTDAIVRIRQSEAAALRVRE